MKKIHFLIVILFMIFSFGCSSDNANLNDKSPNLGNSAINSLVNQGKFIQNNNIIFIASDDGVLYRYDLDKKMINLSF